MYLNYTKGRFLFLLEKRGAPSVLFRDLLFSENCMLYKTLNMQHTRIRMLDVLFNQKFMHLRLGVDLQSIFADY